MVPHFLLGQPGLAGVFDDEEVMLFGDGHDFVHIGGDAEDVDGEDGLGVLGDLGFHLVGIDLEGFGVGVDHDG